MRMLRLLISCRSAEGCRPSTICSCIHFILFFLLNSCFFLSIQHFYSTFFPLLPLSCRIYPPPPPSSLNPLPLQCLSCSCPFHSATPPSPSHCHLPSSLSISSLVSINPSPVSVGSAFHRHLPPEVDHQGGRQRRARPLPHHGGHREAGDDRGPGQLQGRAQHLDAAHPERHAVHVSSW